MTPAGSAELSKIARGGAVNVLGSIVNGLMGFLLVFVLSRALDKSDAGTFFALSSVFLIVLAAVELGAPTGLVRWMQHYLAVGQPERLRATLRAGILPVLVVSCAASAALWPLAPTVIDILSREPVTEAAVAGMRALSVFLPIAAVYDLALAATRGFERIRPTVTVERVARVSIQFILVWLAALASASLAVLSVAWALPYLPALIVTVSITIRLLHRAEHRARLAATAASAPAAAMLAGTARGRRKAQPGVMAEFWAYTWARGLSRIFQVALQRLDIVMIYALLTARDAAVYTAVTRLVPLGLLGVQAVQQVLQPTLARLLSKQDLEAARRVYRAATAWSMALAWPVYIAAVAIAPHVVAIFGAGYDDGVATLVIVSLAMLVATACGAADMALLMSGRSTLSLLNTLVALIADVGLNLLLLPRIGITGAGIAWAVAILLTNLPPLEQVRRSVGITPQSRGAALVAVSSVVCFGVAPWLTFRVLDHASVLKALPWLALFGLTYLGVLARARKVLEARSPGR